MLDACPEPGRVGFVPHVFRAVRLMSVELRHLRYFIALAEAKSFGRAAVALGIAQPALSQQIRRLENELDVVLFVRGNDGSHLTAAGKAFLPGATASVADARDAAVSAQRAERGESGHLKVGFIGSSADNLIPAALRLFREECPDVEISLAETDLAQLPGCFEREELDVAFVRRPVDDPSLLTELVLVDDVVAVLPEDHPLAGQTRAGWRDHGLEVCGCVVMCCFLPSSTVSLPSGNAWRDRFGSLVPPAVG